MSLPILHTAGTVSPGWAALLRTIANGVSPNRAAGELNPPPGPATPAADAVDLRFLEAGLSARMLHALLEVLDATRLPGASASLSASAESRYQAARAAAQRQDLRQVLSQLERAFAAHPRYVARADSDSAFERYRAEVLTLLNRLATRTRIEAEDGIEKAAQTLERAESPRLKEAVPEAQLLVSLARSAVQTHHYSSLFVAARAARLSLLAVEGYLSSTSAEPVEGGREPQQAAVSPGERPGHACPPALVAGGIVTERTGSLHALRPARVRFGALHRLAGFAMDWCKSIWFRFPLLAMLLAWFVLGLVGGLGSLGLRLLMPGVHHWPPLSAGFSIWGMGFLALVVVGFLVSVRRLLR